MEKLQHHVFVGLGSNLENPAFQLKSALQSIAELPATQLLRQSSFYASKPLGPQDQPDFVNAVCEIITNLSPEELLQALQMIEQEQGRIKKRHWGERLIDLDILLYDQLIMHTADLIIPHSQMHLRDFVLIPLQELAPELEIPHAGTLQALISSLDESYLIRLQE